MPIRVQNDLPVKEILEKENIFVMDEHRATHQDIRLIKIGLLNLMPLKEDTELQILRSLSNTPLQIDVTFVAVSSHESKNTSSSHLNKFYEKFSDIKDQKFELLQGGCTFAIENTMVTHNPEVKEKLEELGIRVMVERSSYEKHPLGRLEWIKLFGILFGKQQQADDYFNKQVKRVKPIMEKKSTGKKVAFFAVSSDGTITVRKPNDYVSAMIGLAGGTYSLGNYTDEEKNALSTMKMQMEDFYSAEIDADVLIYNGTIEGELTSIDELVKKNSLFADFQAVKSGQVYTTGSNFYQQSTGTCDFIEDLNQILTGEGDGTYRFLKKLQ